MFGIKKRIINKITEIKILHHELKGSSKFSDENRIIRELLLNSHSLEKSLGMRTFEPGHGYHKIEYLLDAMLEGVNIINGNAFAVREAMAIARTYLSYQDNNDSKIIAYKNKLESMSKMYSIRENNLECNSGIFTIGNLDCTEANYSTLIKARHSVRMYTSSKISLEIIKKAVELANYAPSACNRQPSKVYFTNEEDKVEKIDNAIFGTNGFENEIHNFAIITVNRSLFTTNEALQWYINGGIYTAFFSLALTSLNIGNIIMQCAINNPKESNLRNICKIPINEAIICIMGLGEIEQEFKAIYAQRKSVEDTLNII